MLGRSLSKTGGPARGPGLGSSHTTASRAKLGPGHGHVRAPLTLLDPGLREAHIRWSYEGLFGQMDP